MNLRGQFQRVPCHASRWLAGERRHFAIITPAGIALAVDHLERSLSEAKEAKAPGVGGETGAATPPETSVPTCSFAAEVLKQALPKIRSEVSYILLGISGIDGQDMHLTAWVQLAPGGTWRAACDGPKEDLPNFLWQPAGTDMLAGGQFPTLLRKELVANFAAAIAERHSTRLSDGDRTQLATVIGKFVLPIGAGGNRRRHRPRRSQSLAA